MTTKLKSLFGPLAHNVEKAYRNLSDFKLRMSFAVCLFVIAAQVGVAGDWDNTAKTMTYNFSQYSSSFVLTQSGDSVKTINGKWLYTMEDRDGSNYIHKLDAIFAAQNVDNWRIENFSGYCLYQGGSGYRYLSISNLFQGVTITINYDRAIDGSKPEKERSITAVDDSYVSESLSDHVLEPNTTYTLAKDGPLDLVVARYVKIRSIIINYTNHPLLFKRNDENIKYYKNNVPYYRCQLSSRNFTEPAFFDANIQLTAQELEIETVETSNGYAPAVFQTSDEAHTTITIPYDIMTNNLGVSQVTAKHNGIEDSYRIEVWDNIASHTVTEILSGSDVVGHKFQLTGPGVVHNRTIRDVPGIEMKFSVTGDVEPNTTVACYQYNHIVAFTNDNWGWWDRFPHTTYSEPSGGTFYTFKATAKGKLKFGGTKMGASGRVYLVKTDNNGFQQADLFLGKHTVNNEEVDGPTGYLDNSDFESTDNTYFKIGEDGIEMVPGVTYDLQGETTTGNPGRWAPYLLEWFSYELDNTLRVNKTFAVADKIGSELTSTGNGKYSYTATDVDVDGTPQVGWTINNVWKDDSTKVKGHIKEAKVRLTSGHLEFYDIEFSDATKKGGAIKVRLRTAENNYIDFTLTIPYGKHVWDFRSKKDQTGAVRPGAWQKTDPELWDMMEANTSANWQLVWKVRNSNGKHQDPIIVANSTIEGDNAFCMDNTAGLVFVTGARSFGARDQRPDDNDKNNWTVAQTDSTNLLWVKGNATIYFPGVTAGQYVKIYTYRHSDDKGETFRAKNFVDLDNNPYNVNDKFLLHGMWEERRPGYVGDNIKGCAIFRVPTPYTPTSDLENTPQLTLCDDGWMKIYRIEIMDEFEPDIILTDDNPGGDFYPVDFDGKFGSVVVKKRGNYTYPVDKIYTATVGQTQCQHANTCDYEVIAGTGVVDINREVWRSSGGVDYNRLNMRYKKAGQVRIVQREKAKIVGSTNIWTETRDENENMVFKSSNDAAVAASTLPSGYVIDKNEYYINVGELTVQNYPFTWDFTTHNMYQGTSATKTNLGTSGSNWSVSGNTCSQKASREVGFGTGTGQTPQNKTVTKALFPQGAQLTDSAGVAVAETEGLGLFRPRTAQKVHYYYSTVDNVFDKRERKYDGYSLQDDAIKINGEILEGTDSILIPEVPSGMYIFIHVVDGGVKFGKVKAGNDALEAIWGNGDPFDLKNNVYCYYQNSGSKQDVTVPLSNEGNNKVKIKEIAITNITKGLDKFGCATESRDRAIDHTYEGELTNNDVNAYIVTTSDGYGTPYNYKGYPMVKKTRITTDIVPANVGVVLCKDNHNGNPFTSPLFVPAVNNVPAQNAANGEFWMNNWMIPNVKSTVHDSEVTSLNAATSAEPSINTLPYYDHGNIRTPDWNVNSAQTTIFGSYSSDPVRYVDLAGYKELRVYQTDDDNIRCFFIGRDGSPQTVNPSLISGSKNRTINLEEIYNSYGQVKLISIKASSPNTTATVTDVKVIPYANPSSTECTKFIMAPSYYVYYQKTGGTSEEKQAETESFFRMRLYQGNDASLVTEYNTLAANKALLLIGSLPTALWNAPGTGARQGVIYMDLQDIEDTDATGVDAPVADATSDEQAVYYTLSGNRTNGKPTKKGIYVSNGKKVCVK